VKETPFYVPFPLTVDFARAATGSVLPWQQCNTDSNCRRHPNAFTNQLPTSVTKDQNQNSEMTSLSSIGQYTTLPKIAKF
jgi:hypothetical protein